MVGKSPGERAEAEGRFELCRIAYEFLKGGKGRQGEEAVWEYERMLWSRGVRGEQEKRRVENMDERRRGMKEAMEARERKARAPSWRGDDDDDGHILGKSRTKSRNANEEERRRFQEERAEKERAREDRSRLTSRQVRIKWKKKMSGTVTSQTISDEIAKRCFALVKDDSREVENIEMSAGGKNKCVVTFRDVEGAARCVVAWEGGGDFVAEGVGLSRNEAGEICASWNENENEDENENENENENGNGGDRKRKRGDGRDDASGMDKSGRKLTREEERRRIIRRMEMEEKGIDPDSIVDDERGEEEGSDGNTGEKAAKDRAWKKGEYPPDIPQGGYSRPSGGDMVGQTWYGRALREMEKEIFA